MSIDSNISKIMSARAGILAKGNTPGVLKMASPPTKVALGGQREGNNLCKIIITL
jgi:hypothetical protein